MPYQMEDGRWKASKTIEGRRRQKTFATKKKALAWESRQTAEKWLAKEQTPTVCLFEWAKAYLAHSEACDAETTFKEKRAAFRFFFRGQEGLSDVLVTEYSEEHAYAHLSRQYRQRSGNAANKDRKNLSHAWKWGRKSLLGFPKKDTELNPFLEVDRFPEKRKPRYVPPESDFWAVFDRLEGQDRVMLTAFLHLGARRGEVFRLKWDDVDFNRNQVGVTTIKDEDGSERHEWLPMTEELRAALRWWWEARTHKSSPFVFTVTGGFNFENQYEGEPFAKRSHFMRKACKRAGVKRFGFHAIRHLTASILWESGYELRVIQRIMRHKSPQTTERYLRKLGIDPSVREAVQAVERHRPAKVIPFAQKESPRRCNVEG